jgi:hypothetical protein
METVYTHITNLTVTQRDTTTQLIPLPTGQVTVLTAQGGLMGPQGPQGSQGIPGNDGAAQIPEIMDGGNF